MPTATEQPPKVSQASLLVSKQSNLTLPFERLLHDRRLIVLQ